MLCRAAAAGAAGRRRTEGARRRGAAFTPQRRAPSEQHTGLAGVQASPAGAPWRYGICKHSHQVPAQTYPCLHACCTASIACLAVAVKAASRYTVRALRRTAPAAATRLGLWQRATGSAAAKIPFASWSACPTPPSTCGRLGPSFSAATACSHDASQRHAQLSIPRLCSAWGPHTGPPHLLTVSECRVAARLGPPSCFLSPLAGGPSSLPFLPPLAKPGRSMRCFFFGGPGENQISRAVPQAWPSSPWQLSSKLRPRCPLREDTYH